MASPLERSCDITLAVVTGANAGLGYETTLGLAREGVAVVMACRNPDRAETAKAEIESQVPDASLSVMVVDLADLASVRSFAEEFRSGHDSLDLLINNAGIMWVPYATSPDGFESHMAANYFGHYLLTSLLLEEMPDSPSSRVVSLGSNTHRQGLKRIKFEDIHWSDEYSKVKAYAHSKLACLLFANELDRRLRRAGKEVMSVASHPGVSATELDRHLPDWQQRAYRMLSGLVTHPTSEGAKSTLLAALGPDVEGGKYYGPQGVGEMRGPAGEAKQHPAAQDPDAAARLWDLSQELTGARWPALAG